jgi:thiopeptide-type bacteriocin biosynthesis protein
MDILLDGLGLTLNEKLTACEAVRNGFAREHHVDQRLLRQLGERFRAERASVEALFESGTATTDGTERTVRATAALRRMACQLEPPLARLRFAAAHGELSLPLSEIAPSLLHMHANRLLRSDQRRHEIVLYDFLHRLYDAQSARTRSAATAQQEV